MTQITSLDHINRHRLVGNRPRKPYRSKTVDVYATDFGSKKFNVETFSHHMNALIEEENEFQVDGTVVTVENRFRTDGNFSLDEALEERRRILLVFQNYTLQAYDRCRTLPWMSTKSLIHCINSMQGVLWDYVVRPALRDLIYVNSGVSLRWIELKMELMLDIFLPVKIHQ